MRFAVTTEPSGNMFNKNYLYYPLVCLQPWLIACQQQASPKPTKKEQAAPTVVDSQPAALSRPKEVIDTDFDLTGFLNDNNYKLQYESFGFLNGDTFKDKVVVLQEYNEGGIYNPRITMVLLGNKRGFCWYSQSNTIMPVEYGTENDNKLFDTENVKIEEGKLTFQLYQPGANGHIYFDYFWSNGKLSLHEFTGTFAGAGSHSAITYLAQTDTTGTIKETNVNTLDEETLPETTKRSIKLKCPTSFENFDYDRCLKEIMQ